MSHLSFPVFLDFLATSSIFPIVIMTPVNHKHNGKSLLVRTLSRHDGTSSFKKQPTFPQSQRAPTPMFVSDDSDIEDDEPTPKANMVESKHARYHKANTLFPNRPLMESRRTSYIRDSDGSNMTYLEAADWDSTNEGDEFIPIKISPSIKRTLEEQANNKRSQPLSLIVPRSSIEPELEYATYLLQPPPTPLSSDILASLSNGGYSAGKKSLTPSLDSTCTTVEVGSGLCPSTPIEDDEGSWSVPILLDAEASDVLKHMSHEPEDLDHSACLSTDMAERGLGIQLDVLQRVGNARRETTEPFSAVTVPSPDVFFASLDADAQQVWRFSLRHVSSTTAVAEEFYDVPWRRKQDGRVELEASAPLTLPTMTTNSETINDENDLNYEPPAVEYDENYQPKLLNDGQVNLDRTKTWIQMQETWLQKRVLSLVVVDELTSECTLEDLAAVVDIVSPSEQEPTIPSVEPESKTPITAVPIELPIELPTKSEQLAYDAFQHLFSRARDLDPVLLQKVRAEAVQNRRLYLPAAHLASLNGIFTMKATIRPKTEFFSHIPTGHLPVSPDDGVLAKKRERIQRVDKERNMLEQLEPSFWYLQALEYLSGGSLLPIAAVKRLRQTRKKGSKPRMLVLAGQACAGFGWAVAINHRQAKVYTTVVASKTGMNRADWMTHRGPSNHRVVTTPNTWTLPFPDGTFDVVSARTLHMLLRTARAHGTDRNDYDATLAEITRVLTPGGILHFSLMDASLTAATGTSLDMLAGDFAHALNAAGYDAKPTRHFLSRLRRAGFVDIKRMRLALPLCGAKAGGVVDMTGMVGSIDWERWMRRFDEEQERVAFGFASRMGDALDEARECGSGRESEAMAAWTVLVGCARKG